jgi:hypothetical protein
VSWALGHTQAREQAFALLDAPPVDCLNVKLRRGYFPDGGEYCSEWSLRCGVTDLLLE